MHTHMLEVTSLEPGSQCAHEERESLLVASFEELAGLRFSILLTARWEGAAVEDQERRNELRAKLVSLRRKYSNKIDDIAMTFGIQRAMNAKEEVERTVTIPRGMDLPMTLEEDNDLCL
jgi:hypothetical protein